MAVRGERALPEAIGAEVDEHDRGRVAFVGGRRAAEKDVLELDVSVSDAGFVERSERSEDTLEDRENFIEAGGARAQKPRAQRLRVEGEVADPKSVFALADFELGGQSGVVECPDHSCRREKALDGALVARRFSASKL